MFLLSRSHSIWGAGFPPRISLIIWIEVSQEEGISIIGIRRGILHKLSLSWVLTQQTDLSETL